MPSNGTLAKIHCSPIKMGILGVLFKNGRSLRPSELIGSLKEIGILIKTENKVFYHLRQLEAMGLVSKHKIGHSLSLYIITERGKKILQIPFIKKKMTIGVNENHSIDVKPTHFEQDINNEERMGIEEAMAKAIFGSKIRPDVFEALLRGETSVSDLAKKLGVSSATVLTSIAPLLPYRTVNASLRPEKSIALGRGVPMDEKTKELVGELARHVMKTRETIRKLAEEIAKSKG